MTAPARKPRTRRANGVRVGEPVVIRLRRPVQF
jgi:hypothetical protein